MAFRPCRGISSLAQDLPQVRLGALEGQSLRQIGPPLLYCRGRPLQLRRDLRLATRAGEDGECRQQNVLVTRKRARLSQRYLPPQNFSRSAQIALLCGNEAQPEETPGGDAIVTDRPRLGRCLFP